MKRYRASRPGDCPAISEFLRLEQGVEQVGAEAERQHPAHEVRGAHDPPPRREIAHAIQCEAAYSPAVTRMKTMSTARASRGMGGRLRRRAATTWSKRGPS